MNQAIWQQLKRYLPAHARRLTPDTDLRDDLGLDSIDCVELIIRLENKYGIRIPDVELEQLRTAADLVRCMERHLQPVRLAAPFAFSCN